MKTKQVVVHLRFGYDYKDGLHRKILNHLKGKNPGDVIFLSDFDEFNDKAKYSKAYGFPQGNFYSSHDGHCGGANLPLDFYKCPNVEIMGYSYSPSGMNRCVNNAASDLGYLVKHVEILTDLVKIMKPGI